MLHGAPFVFIHTAVRFTPRMLSGEGRSILSLLTSSATGSFVQFPDPTWKGSSRPEAASSSRACRCALPLLAAAVVDGVAASVSSAASSQECARQPAQQARADDPICGECGAACGRSLWAVTVTAAAGAADPCSF